MSALPRINAAAAPQRAATPASIAEIPTRITAPQAIGSVSKASMMLDMEPGASKPTAKVTVNLHGGSFINGSPRFDVKSMSLYETATGKLIAKTNSPKGSPPEGMEGSSDQKFTFEVPFSKVDDMKQYTVVVNAGMNGTMPRDFRSEYFRPMGAM